MSRHVPVHLVRLVRRRAKNICEYCLLPQECQEATFHVDHVRPRSAGGKTTSENLALACVSCSLRKAARIRVRDSRTGRTVAIFNPRRDEWTRHFRVTKTMRILGRTSQGRATVRALGMNRDVMVAIRRELLHLGRFPA